MKKWFNPLALLLIVSGTLFLTSCGGTNEDEGPVLTPLIVGEWQYQSADVDITINDKDIFDYLVAEWGLSEEQAVQFAASFEESMNDFDGMSWKFNADGTYELTDPEETESGTWSLSADKSKLTLTSNGESDIINVSTLTSSKLVLSYTETFEEDMNEDGTNEAFGISIILEMKK